MGYSGAWKESNAATLGEDSRVFAPRDNWGDGVDPRHDVRTAHDQWSDIGYPYPVNPVVQAALPPQIEDQYSVELIPQTLPSPWDGEPKGHEGVATAPWGVGDWRAQTTNNIAREQDRGMPRALRQRSVVGRDFSQTYYSGPEYSLEYTDQSGSSSVKGQALRALRGKNALDVNNPGSAEVNFSGNYRRRGKEVVRWTNRRMPKRTITHTKRPLYLNLAATAKPSVAPQGDNYSPYTSPFDGRTSTFNQNAMTPMVRREQRPWDEDVITDGSETVNGITDFITFWM